MPIIKSAKKALRQSAKKHVYNLRRSRAMKSAVKDVRAVAGASAKDADAKLSSAYKAIDKAVKRGIIKKNAAARTKSRLSKFIKKTTSK